MQALLLSPATTFLSPDSSSSLSPATPPLPSLDFLTLDDHRTQDEEYESDDDADTSQGSTETRTGAHSTVDTPTHPRKQQQQQPSKPITLERRQSIPPVPLTTPRVPSNLRYAFSADQSGATTADHSTISTSTLSESSALDRDANQSPVQNDGTSIQLIQFDHTFATSTAGPLAMLSPNTSSVASVGTFVVNSTRNKPQDDAEDQLAAAIKAFNGPARTAGLFASDPSGNTDRDEENLGQAGGNKPLSAMDPRGKGLLSLFEPISPPAPGSMLYLDPHNSLIPDVAFLPVPLPRSTMPAPSLDSFSFSPPSSRATDQTPLAVPFATPSQSTPSFLSDCSADQTPLAIPPLVPTRTPLPMAKTPGIMRPTGLPPITGVLERKAEKQFLKRSTSTSISALAPPRSPPSTTSSSSLATIRPPTPPSPPLPGQAPFSIQDLIQSLPENVPPVQTGAGTGDVSTTQEFESARSRSRFDSYDHPYNSNDTSIADSDGDVIDKDPLSEEEDTTTDERADGFVPPSTMTLRQLKENGFVSSSASSANDDSAEEEEDADSESGEQQNLYLSQRDGGFSSSEGEEETAEMLSSSRRHQTQGRYRGPLQSSSNAPSSVHSSFAQLPLSPPSISLPAPPELEPALDRLHPDPTALAASAHARAIPASPLKLFQSTYDTYTRHHLNEIVDLVDATDSASSAALDPFGDDSSEEGFLGDEGRRRSCKRIKLSPPSLAGADSRDNTLVPEGRDEGDEEASPIRWTTDRTPKARSERCPRSERSSSLSTTRRKTEEISMSTRKSSEDRHQAANEAETPGDRRERARDRRGEAMELMERIRKRAEGRETKRRNGQTSSTNRLSRSPPQILRVSPEPRTTSSTIAKVSPPPLPHLAAAASASIRSVLGSPAPSHASPRLFSSVASPAQQYAGFPRAISSQTRAHSALAKSDSTLGHKRRASLTTIHPASVDAQRLLASVRSEARSKGLVFDNQLQRWIRTPRKHAMGVMQISELAEQTAEDVEGREDEERDPFKDFSDLTLPTRDRPRPAASNASAPALNSERIIPPSTTTAAPSALVSPPSTLNRVDLDNLPHPGDGSGSLKQHHFDLSGLGISKGTPPLLHPPAKSDLPDKSPEGVTYFEAPPSETRDNNCSPLLRIEGEEEDEVEDSASWGGEPVREADRIDRGSASPVGNALPTVPVQSSPASMQHERSAPASTATPLPRSALKPSRSKTDPTGLHSSMTPTRKLGSETESRLPRSVSFSDGKTQGKIENTVRIGHWQRSRLRYDVRAAQKPDDVDLGTRGGEFGDLEMDGDVTKGDSPVSRHGKQPNTLTSDASQVARDCRRSSSAEDVTETSLVHSSFDSVSPADPRPPGDVSRSRTFTRSQGSRNATFLTECSFGVSHDRLLQFITDVEPFEPNWEGLRSIDLSGKKAESVVRLKEFLPKLDEVNLNNNDIAYLTGIPTSLRTLLVASNRLSSMVSFHHLRNLERLDLSGNVLDSLQHLSVLRHLRDLKLDDNHISSIDGLRGLDGLVRLSMKGNRLQGVLDLSRTSWSRLEVLVLARNDISTLRGLEMLESLSSLNLDHNSLTSFEPTRSHSRLRILRLCNNPISHLDVSFAPRLRTLYIDSAQLGVVEGTEQLRKLENFSMRDQSGETLTLTMPHLREVKRLYLSGNPLPLAFPSEKFFNLTYLELAMCHLTSLPQNLAALVPNVRSLNLNFNFLDSLEPLTGLSRLGKLSVVGARLSKVRPVVRVLASLPELESLDLRSNPITLAFYPPMGHVNDTLMPSHHEHRILHPDSVPLEPSTSHASCSVPAPEFCALDSKFRKALPEEWLFKRNAYRTALMHAVPTLVKLDGIDCTRERKKARKVFEKLQDREADSTVSSYEPRSHRPA
ncbi:uncharacterized protein JCM15063_002361 [Sporobolomyces koalae]|uniref:uncharacterized protein n=1 Tax=Sporobolomyces koalae TaxID=500713 RepID=UPI00317BE46B